MTIVGCAYIKKEDCEYMKDAETEDEKQIAPKICSKDWIIIVYDGKCSDYAPKGKEF